MGKEKNRNRRINLGSTSKENLDFLSNPIYAKALARTEPMPVGWASGPTSPFIAKQKKVKAHSVLVLNGLGKQVETFGNPSETLKMRATSSSSDNEDATPVTETRPNMEMSNDMETSLVEETSNDKVTPLIEESEKVKLEDELVTTS